MNGIEISVIVLTYNATLSSLLLTLQSIIEQDFDKFEIIIADDNSKVKYFSEIQKYFAENSFERYKILDSTKNVGTVKNYIRGIKSSEGKYIKPIGAGDFLFDKTTLKRIYNFMKDNAVDIGFGLMQGYQKDCQYNIYKSDFKAPISIKPYLNNNLKQIKKKVIFQGDYISGATLFGETNFLLEYLLKIDGVVRVTEDVIQVLILLDGKNISLLNEKIIFYEVGSGISTKRRTNKEKVSTNLDHEAFWKYVGKAYKYRKLLERCDFQIRLLNENSRIRKNVLLLLKNRQEFLNNRIRKFWKNNLKGKINEGFLKNEAFIANVQNRS